MMLVEEKFFAEFLKEMAKPRIVGTLRC